MYLEPFNIFSQVLSATIMYILMRFWVEFPIEFEVA